MVEVVTEPDGEEERDPEYAPILFERHQAAVELASLRAEQRELAYAWLVDRAHMIDPDNAANIALQAIAAAKSGLGKSSS